MGVISEPVATEIIKYLEVLESVQCQQYHGLSTPNNIFFLKLSSVHAFPLLELLFFFMCIRPALQDEVLNDTCGHINN